MASMSTPWEGCVSNSRIAESSSCKKLLVKAQYEPPHASSASAKKAMTESGVSAEKSLASQEEGGGKLKMIIRRKITSDTPISIIMRQETSVLPSQKKRIPRVWRRIHPEGLLQTLHNRISALRWESALKIYDIVKGQFWYRPNSDLYIRMIIMLGKSKQPDKAYDLFEEMGSEGCSMDCKAYNALLFAYCRNNLIEKAQSLFDRMKTIPGRVLDVSSYLILIKLYLHFFIFDKVQYLLCEMKSCGIRMNTAVYNTLIDAHGKANRFVDLKSLLIEMLRDDECPPDIWTLNSTLIAFGKCGQIGMMEKCYEKFRAAGIRPGIRTFNILLDSYAKFGDYNKMGFVIKYMQKYDVRWMIVTYNTVIDAFGKAGDLEEMEHLFEAMQSEGIKPDCVTLCSLLRAYGRAKNSEQIRWVVQYAESRDVMLNVIFYNCMIDAYGRVGWFGEMMGVVDLMRAKGVEPNKVTYETLLDTYISNQMYSHAMEIRGIMRENFG